MSDSDHVRHLSRAVKTGRQRPRVLTVRDCVCLIDGLDMVSAANVYVLQEAMLLHKMGGQEAMLCCKMGVQEAMSLQDGWSGSHVVARYGCPGSHVVARWVVRKPCCCKLVARWVVRKPCSCKMGGWSRRQSGFDTCQAAWHAAALACHIGRT
jgi:hypothetical protein